MTKASLRKQRGGSPFRDAPNDLAHFLSLSQFLFCHVVTSHSSLKSIIRWSIASFAILQQWKVSSGVLRRVA